MRTPLNRVKYLGSAKEGTGHFITQRLTALANVPLVLFAVWLAVTALQTDRAGIVELFSNPLVAGAAILLMVSVCIHMRVGMQVIIEDYIHAEGSKLALLLGNTFFSYGIMALSLVSILKLSFGG